MISRAEKEHRAFVLSTWVRSAWQMVKKDVPYETFMSYEPRLAELRFESGHVWVDTEDGYSINGWVAGDPDKNLLFHVYVAPELRGFGLGTKLISVIGEKPEVIRCPRLNRVSKLPLGPLNPYLLLQL